MAIVPNLAGTTPIDKSFVFRNRTNAGEPNGALTPQFAGEIVLDTTNNALWKSIDTTNTSWVTLTTPF